MREKRTAELVLGENAPRLSFTLSLLHDPSEAPAIYYLSGAITSRSADGNADLPHAMCAYDECGYEALGEFYFGVRQLFRSGNGRVCLSGDLGTVRLESDKVTQICQPIVVTTDLSRPVAAGEWHERVRAAASGVYSDMKEVMIMRSGFCIAADELARFVDGLGVFLQLPAS